MAFDPTPGFNIAWKPSNLWSLPYVAATGTQTALGYGTASKALGGNSSKQQQTPSATPKNEVTQTPITETNTGVLGSSTNTPNNLGGYNPEVEQARYQIEQGINSGNDALGRLTGQQNTAMNNINGQFQSAFGRLTGQRDVARRDNQTAVNNQLQDYQTARDDVNSNARNLLLGARRLMGSQGAGGGSADLFGAPLAATQEGNNANAAVKQTNERNLGALSTAYDDNERQFESSFNDLNTQRDQSVRDTTSQFDQQRADILNNIATLTGQRSILNGQNYQAALASAQPFTSRINGILANIDRLAANPAPIREQAVNLARPDLAQYNLGRFDAPAVAQQDPTFGMAARTLFGIPDDQQRQQLAY